MTTKFSALVQIRKDAVKNAEQKLIGVNQRIASAQIDLSVAQQQLAEIAIPQKGSYNDLLYFQQIKESYLNEIDRIIEFIAALRLERKVIEEEMRLLNIEFEKANYLDSLEKTKILKERRYKESAQLDEISILLHNARHNLEGDSL